MKLRVKPIDVKNDIYIIERKFLGVLWITAPEYGCGSFIDMVLPVNAEGKIK